MKTLRNLLLVASLLTGMAAHAEVSAEANEPARHIWNCNLSFNAKGGGLQLIVGRIKLAGEGLIKCTAFDGTTQELPVKISMHTTPIALNVGAGKIEFHAFSKTIGTSRGVESLLGKYVVVMGNASVGLGLGAELGLHGGFDHIAMTLGLNIVRGLGFELGVNRLTIEPAN